MCGQVEDTHPLSCPDGRTGSPWRAGLFSFPPQGAQPREEGVQARGWGSSFVTVPRGGGAAVPSPCLRSRPERGGPGPLTHGKAGPPVPCSWPLLPGLASTGGRHHHRGTRAAVLHQRPLRSRHNQRGGFSPLREDIPQQDSCLQALSHSTWKPGRKYA